MRGFAAFYVLLLHIVVVYGFTGRPMPAGLDVFRFGWIGVDFFFVLSGFLLAIPLLEGGSMRRPGFWRTYVVKRWWRIAPPYYVSIIVALVIAGSLSTLVQRPTDILLHVSFLHSLRADTLTSIDPVYWTLASEFQFYLMLPLFILVLRRPSWPISLGAMALITFGWRAATWNGPGNSWMSFTFPAFLLHFTLGILAARAYLAGFRSPLRARIGVPIVVVALIVLPLAVLGTASASQGDNSLLANILLRPVVGLGFAAAILLVTSERSAFRDGFGSRPMQILGERSYSLYLIHVPLLEAFVKVPAFSQNFWVYAAATTLASLAAAAIFFALVEGPSLAVREWMTTRDQRMPATPSLQPRLSDLRRTPSDAS